MSLRSFTSLFLIFAVLLGISALLANLYPHALHAQSIAEIKSQIDQHNQAIAELEAEIAIYQKELNVISGQKQTYESAIKSIDISRQKILAQVSVTQAKITATNLKLDQLALKITDKSEAIALDLKAVAQAMRRLQHEEDASLIERIFAADTLTDGWTSVDQLSEVNGALKENADGLANDRIVLTDQHTAVEATKAELGQLRRQLVTQQGELDANKAEKQRLLNQANQTATTYQSIIEQKRAQQKAFESALSALEDSLNVTVSPSSIPSVGTGVLAWPYTSAFADSCISKAGALANRFCITQYFGTTPFSTANPQVYNGSGHNGIDIGMPSGTSVLAALGGSVMGTGNTDAIPGCYSFGKWVLVKHANGITTLYAHLSSISVSPGQAVATGAVLGYSGMTGYATGPHLHFATYASQGVQIMTLGQFRGATTPCANARMPVAPKEAYLNPMSYL
ncbi:MAG: hypothetical protein QOE22_720 [Candidatus Parcubacteria bacterium]|jgi:murein DD-endopeptidase MepM/ murein hydrolase activator NlpD|nr:hypothetical protein [Candidatus Parcubacteria bacterium]